MKYLLYLFLFFSFSLSAQTVKVKGTIKDSIGNPLEFASVIAVIKSTGKTESYGITNYEGRYQMDLPTGDTYTLQSSFLGFQNAEKTLEIPKNSGALEQNFILKPQADELKGVEITYEMPVTVRGDTITYNADSFTNGEERKLGNVMKKLPGVEVNADGEIEVEGKKVTKVMVEGKDFFDGDSKLATKNIPADAVDKVEVLRNYNEVGQMKGLGNDQDNVAINIRLKEGKKNFWFGEVTAGAGLADTYGDENGRYLVHPKLFYYSPKYSINLITDFNNIGEVPFTFRDYFNFTGGFRNFNRGGGTSFNIQESDLGFAVSQNSRAKEIEAGFVAGNFSYAPSKTLDLSGFAILSDNKTNIANNSIRQYITTGVTETTNSVNDQRNQLGMLKLSSVYKPNTNFQFDYDAIIKTSKQTEDDTTLSQFSNFNNNIEEVKENKPFSVNQNANVYYTLNDKNIFAGQVQYLYQNEDPFYNAITDLLPFPEILPLDVPQNRYNINQEKDVKSNKVDAKVDYYYVLNNTSNLNFTLGTTYSNQTFNSNIFQLLDNSDRLDFNVSQPVDGKIVPLINDVAYSFTDAFFGLHYKVKKGIFILTPGVTLHNYNLKNKQLGSTTTQNDWMVLPDVNVIIELKKSENIRFNYAITSEYTDINNYAEAYVFNNYNNLYRGNRNLENSLSQSYNLTYFSFNLFNYTNIGGNLNYTRKIDGIKRSADIQNINQTSTLINIDSNFPDETFSAVGRFSKRVKKFQFNFNAAVVLNKSNSLFNDLVRESQSLTQNYKASVRTNFKNWPNFEAGYNYTINDYDNGGLKRTFFTESPFANIDLRFLKDFTLSAEWNYYNYTDDAKTIKNQYSFLKGDLYYKPNDCPWEFSVQATNILNTKFINNDSFTETLNSTSQYFVMPRIVMLVFKYDL